MDKISIVSMNCHGLNHLIKRKRVITALACMRPTILFLQETHLKDKSFSYFKAPWFAHYFHSAGSTRSRGTAILISKSSNFVLHLSETDPLGRYVFLNGSLDGFPVTLASVYAPNVAQLEFIEQFFQKLDNFKTGNVILGGDLNFISDTLLDRCPSPKPTKIPAHSSLQLLFEKFDFLDIWRHQHPTDRDYTYFSAVHQVHTRIDYFLLSKALALLSTHSEIGSPLWSDHAWTSCQLLLHNAHQSKNRDWCLNTSILFKEEVCTQISDDIQNFVMDNADCGVPTCLLGCTESCVEGVFHLIRILLREKEGTIEKRTLGQDSDFRGYT